MLPERMSDVASLVPKGILMSMSCSIKIENYPSVKKIQDSGFSDGQSPESETRNEQKRQRSE